MDLDHIKKEFETLPLSATEISATLGLIYEPLSRAQLSAYRLAIGNQFSTFKLEQFDPVTSEEIQALRGQGLLVEAKSGTYKCPKEAINPAIHAALRKTFALLARGKVVRVFVADKRQAGIKPPARGEGGIGGDGVRTVGQSGDEAHPRNRSRKLRCMLRACDDGGLANASQQAGDSFVQRRHIDIRHALKAVAGDTDGQAQIRLEAPVQGRNGVCFTAHSCCRVPGVDRQVSVLLRFPSFGTPFSLTLVLSSVYGREKHIVRHTGTRAVCMDFSSLARLRERVAVRPGEGSRCNK